MEKVYMNSIVKSIPALKVKQWLKAWEEVEWNPYEKRSEPQHWFYQFSISASTLKSLSGVYSRTTSDRQRGRDDMGIQRRHEEERSKEISRFVQYGYPWSDLTKAKRESEEFKDLRKPGWLPTAIVINILKENDSRRGKKIDSSDVVRIIDIDDSISKLELPEIYNDNNWKHKTIPPIEIIDGQHRLWAFEDSDFKGDFELPVVAFVGLDLSWQAYLFYTINIKPKKINASLAFDLYPLLRAEDWLNKFEGPIIYREARAQEIVDMLWSHPDSPWHHRINMLGEPGNKGLMVTQSAWIKSLLSTYIKNWEGRSKIGGLFGAPVGSHKEVLPWSREEQTAFLIVIGQHIRNSIKKSNYPWIKTFQDQNEGEAFYGRNSLLNQDQGIRAILHVTNDLFFIKAESLKLSSWGSNKNSELDETERITSAIDSLKKEKDIIQFIKEIADSISSYDWRASGTEGLSEHESLLKAAFRGSGGYKELRRHLLRHLAKEGISDVALVSKTILKTMEWD